MEGVNTSGRIALIRHGQTDWNLEERLQGTTDVPLNDTGRQQARTVARQLHAGATTWDVLVASPLGRAVETAQIIGGVLDLELSATCPGLVERGFGAWEGTSLAGLEAHARDTILAGGEPPEEVARRGTAALRRIRDAHPGRNVLVVAHGSLIRLTVSVLNGGTHPRVRNCEVVPVRTAALDDARLRDDVPEPTAP